MFVFQDNFFSCCLIYSEWCKIINILHEIYKYQLIKIITRMRWELKPLYRWRIFLFFFHKNFLFFFFFTVVTLMTCQSWEEQTLNSSYELFFNFKIAFVCYFFKTKYYQTFSLYFCCFIFLFYLLLVCGFCQLT